jgi:hypothetical protein
MRLPAPSIFFNVPGPFNNGVFFVREVGLDPMLSEVLICHNCRAGLNTWP